MNTPNDLQHEMKRRGLTTSRSHFSTVWLNKPEDYFIQACNRMGLNSLVRLYSKLSDTEHPDLAAAVHALMLSHVERRG